MSRVALVLATVLLATTTFAQESPRPFLGRWALTIPGGGAGWLGVTQEDGYLDASILWGGGSVVPVSSVYVDGDTLYVTRNHTVERKNGVGKVLRRQVFTETITAKRSGDNLSLTQSRARNNGIGSTQRDFRGVRIPDMPKRPNLKKVKFGPAQELIRGNSIRGWMLTNERQTNGWRVEDNILINDTKQEPGARRVSWGNLRTVGEFEDFNLTLEVNVPKGGNSGVYLRGVYEVQVEDSHGKSLDSHNMGAVYSRITPTAAAEKPAGEWQSMDITLVDRHVTVKLNGTTIIDNQPLLGCTGGALTSDEFSPGPLYLQGDHGPVQFRNIILRPVVK